METTQRYLLRLLPMGRRGLLPAATELGGHAWTKLPRGVWRQPSSPGVPELRSGQGRRLRRGASDLPGSGGRRRLPGRRGRCHVLGTVPAVPSGGRLTARARSPARPLLDRDPLDVALEGDDVEILRTEDVQAGRRGPTWTS